MSMPGFAAEASQDKTRGRYQAARAGAGGRRGHDRDLFGVRGTIMRSVPC